MDQNSAATRGISLVVSDVHRVHNVHDRGYLERPARVDAIREALLPSGLFREVRPRAHGDGPVLAVHDAEFLTYFKRVAARPAGADPVYPYVFPVRPAPPPRDLELRAGWYGIDTFTPLDRNAWRAARAAADAALTGADEILRGRAAAYALCRPPGHHAGRRTYGGFCYLNNAAIAAHQLSRAGKVAVLDLDFHHGNGTQDVFWRRADVLTLSLHGHPRETYPYFSGFADELGEGPGRGFNQNFPLAPSARERAWRGALAAALERLARFAPAFVVVPLGFDTMTGDPTGSFSLTARTLASAGREIGALRRPTLVVQEGGYRLRNLRAGAAAFFRGLASHLNQKA